MNLKKYVPYLAVAAGLWFFMRTKYAAQTAIGGVDEDENDDQTFSYAGVVTRSGQLSTGTVLNPAGLEPIQGEHGIVTDALGKPYLTNGVAVYKNRSGVIIPADENEVDGLNGLGFSFKKAKKFARKISKKDPSMRLARASVRASAKVVRAAPGGKVLNKSPANKIIFGNKKRTVSAIASENPRGTRTERKHYPARNSLDERTLYMPDGQDRRVWTYGDATRQETFSEQDAAEGADYSDQDDSGAIPQYANAPAQDDDMDTDNTDVIDVTDANEYNEDDGE